MRYRKWEVIQRLLLYLVILATLAVLTCRTCRGQEAGKTKLDRAQSILACSHVSLAGLDGYSAAHTIDKHGAVESGNYVNWMIAPDEPKYAARVAIAAGTAYGIEKLIGYGFKRDHSKRGRIVLIALQSGLIALNVRNSVKQLNMK